MLYVLVWMPVSAFLNIHSTTFTHLCPQGSETEQADAILMSVVRAQEAAVLFPMLFPCLS